MGSPAPAEIPAHPAKQLPAPLPFFTCSLPPRPPTISSSLYTILHFFRPLPWEACVPGLWVCPALSHHLAISLEAPLLGQDMVIWPTGLPSLSPPSHHSPFSVSAGQDVRLDNRFVDLRTPANQAIFRVQSEVCQVRHLGGVTGGLGCLPVQLEVCQVHHLGGAQRA